MEELLSGELKLKELKYLAKNVGAKMEGPLPTELSLNELKWKDLSQVKFQALIIKCHPKNFKVSSCFSYSRD